MSISDFLVFAFVIMFYVVPFILGVAFLVSLIRYFWKKGNNK